MKACLLYLSGIQWVCKTTCTVTVLHWNLKQRLWISSGSSRNYKTWEMTCMLVPPCDALHLLMWGHIWSTELHLNVCIFVIPLWWFTVCIHEIVSVKKLFAMSAYASLKRWILLQETCWMGKTSTYCISNYTGHLYSVNLWKLVVCVWYWETCFILIFWN